ncbi:hypothetical protein BZA77DRAFT_293244 [Pyronema omphalodes]|nr:hypothetical protein BZA77DRAFT_293244 [Pyronema omphalodes]
MDRIIYNQQGSYLYPLLTPTGAYQPAAQYPKIPTSSNLPFTATSTAEKARQAAATATYNAYAAQAAATRAQAAAIQASRNEAAAAAARLAMLQPKVTQASMGNSWSFVGGAYRMGGAATAPTQNPTPVYRPAPVTTTPVYGFVPAQPPVYRPAPVMAPAFRPAPIPAPVPGGSHWTYNPAGYYVRR